MDSNRTLICSTPNPLSIRGLLYVFIINYELSVNYDETPTIKEPWNIPVPEDLNYYLRMEDGIVHIYKSRDDLEDGRRMSFSFDFTALIIFDVKVRHILCPLILISSMTSISCVAQ